MNQLSIKESVAGSALLLVATTLLAVSYSGLPPLSVPVYLHHDPVALHHWAPILHLSNNSYWMWRFDTELLPFIPSIQSVLWISLAIFTAGLAFLIRQLRPAADITLCAVTSISCSLLLIVLFGFDPTIVSALSWLPWCAVLLLHAQTVSGGLGSSSCLVILPFAIFFGLRLAASANQFALYLLMVALGLSFLRRLTHEDDQLHSVCFWLCLLLMFIPALSVFISAPTPHMPEYPPESLMFSRKAASRSIQSWMFDSSNMALFNRTLLMRHSGLTIALVITTLGCLFAARKRGVNAPLETACFITMLFCAADLLLPEVIARALPVAALERTLPQFSFITITPLLLAATLLISILSSITLQASWIAGVLLVLMLLPGNLIHLPGKSIGRLLDPDWRQGIQQNNHLSTSSRNAIYSPSYPVFRRFGSGTLQHPVLRSATTFKSEPKQIEKLIASDGAPRRRLRRLFDSNMVTHWRPTSGSQQANEWLYIRFVTPQRLNGVQFYSRHRTEFPAAIEVLGTHNCPTDPEIQEGYTLLARHRPWEGTITFTETGHPYYGSQFKGEIFFDKTTPVHCLLIRQIGKRGTEWTVAELRFGFQIPEQTPGPAQNN